MPDVRDGSAPLMERPGIGVVCARALARRCPACGAHGLFEGWFRIRAACPRCGMLTDRGEPDYFLGAVLVNFLIAEIAVAGAAFVAIVLTWPTPRWNLILAGALVAGVAAPIVCYPISKTLWLAADMLVRAPAYAGREAPPDA